jgi:predicted transcriptional regulator
MIEQVMITLKAETLQALDVAAAGLHSDRDDVLAEAVSVYVDLYHAQTREIERGLAELAAGEYVQDDIVAETFARLTHNAD